MGTADDSSSSAGDVWRLRPSSTMDAHTSCLPPPVLMGSRLAPSFLSSAFCTYNTPNTCCSGVFCSRTHKHQASHSDRG